MTEVIQDSVVISGSTADIAPTPITAAPVSVGPAKVGPVTAGPVTAGPITEGAAVTVALLDGWDEQDDELTELGWQERALCAQTDPEAFFPEKGGSTREAKKVCLGCDVRGDCLEYALAHDERFGIWGGLSERERRRLKKEAV